MLVVTVEVWPGGNEEMKHTIAQMAVVNVSNLSDFSDYEIAKEEIPFRTGANVTLHPNPLKLYRTKQMSANLGLVEGHDRLDSVWDLIGKAIEA